MTAAGAILSTVLALASPQSQPSLSDRRVLAPA